MHEYPSLSKSVRYLPAKSVGFASQIRRGNYKNSNIAKIAGKFGRSFSGKTGKFSMLFTIIMAALIPILTP
ncbi:MAG: hypothetical protein ACXV79_14660 [Methylobacter sp.]